MGDVLLLHQAAKLPRFHKPMRLAGVVSWAEGHSGELERELTKLVLLGGAGRFPLQGYKRTSFLAYRSVAMGHDIRVNEPRQNWVPKKLLNSKCFLFLWHLVLRHVEL